MLSEMERNTQPQKMNRQQTEVETDRNKGSDMHSDRQTEYSKRVRERERMCKKRSNVVKEQALISVLSSQ